MESLNRNEADCVLVTEAINIKIREDLFRQFLFSST